jgi:hypothetical protein
MNIRMLKTMRGSPDGIQVFEYQAGQKYDLPDDLAGVFLREGWAEEDKELVLETKALEVKDDAQADSGAGGGADKPRRGKKLPKG